MARKKAPAQGEVTQIPRAGDPDQDDGKQAAALSRKSAEERSQKLKNNVALLSVVCSASLVAMKIIVGLVMGSAGVLAEGLHSSLDLVAAIIATVSVRKAVKPADEKHSYGHGKIENISGAVEAILIFVAAVLIIVEAVDKIKKGNEVESLWLGMGVMGVSAIGNGYVSFRLHRVAKETDSIALEADAEHLRTDVITSVGVMMGLGAIYLTGYMMLDPLIAGLVALIIIKAAWELTMKAAVDLLDSSLTPEELAKINGIIGKYKDQYVEVHKMRSRKAGATKFIDFHLVVCRRRRMEDAHKLTEKIEYDIRELYPTARLTIHLESCEREKSICGTTPQCVKEN